MEAKQLLIKQNEERLIRTKQAILEISKEKPEIKIGEIRKRLKVRGLC